MCGKAARRAARRRRAALRALGLRLAGACRGKMRILCRIEKDGCGLQGFARIEAWFFAGR